LDYRKKLFWTDIWRTGAGNFAYRAGAAI
jgi:hypothetical protein